MKLPTLQNYWFNKFKEWEILTSYDPGKDRLLEGAFSRTFSIPSDEIVEQYLREFGNPEIFEKQEHLMSIFNDPEYGWLGFSFKSYEKAHKDWLVALEGKSSTLSDDFKAAERMQNEWEAKIDSVLDGNDRLKYTFILHPSIEDMVSTAAEDINGPNHDLLPLHGPLKVEAYASPDFARQAVNVVYEIRVCNDFHQVYAIERLGRDMTALRNHVNGRVKQASQPGIKLALNNLHPARDFDNQVYAKKPVTPVQQDLFHQTG
jgi:hypothetical protein